jgi:hypothetical protein
MVKTRSQASAPVQSKAAVQSKAVKKAPQSNVTENKLKFYYIFDSSFARYLRVDGIVLYPFVFIATPKNQTNKQVIKHELIHVHQVRREGPIKFYAKYIYYIFQHYYKHGNFDEAFLHNEYEDEAYQNQHRRLTKEELLEVDLQ